MSMFTQDPTWPVGALLMAAAFGFILLKTRQEGKYLIVGLAALGSAGLVLAFEWAWVTDDERIEAVVYDIRDSLLKGDAQGVLANMTPDVQYVQSGESLPTAATRAMIESSVGGSKFDIVRIRELQTSAGRKTRRGKAEFKAMIRGNVQGPMGLGGAGMADSSWSLGLEETQAGVWKVNRITPISIPISPAIIAGALSRPPSIGVPRDSDPSLMGGRGPGAAFLGGFGDAPRHNPRHRGDRKSVARQQSLNR